MAPSVASLSTKVGVPVAARTSSASGTSIHARCGALRTTPSEVRTRPGTATPTASMRASARGPSRQAATRPAIVSATASGVGVSRLGSRSRARMLRSRPTAAISMASTSGFTAIATTRADALTTGDGRPTRPAMSGMRSSTSPRRTSSPTRSAIVERFSPVCSVRAALERAPSSCTTRRTRERLWARVPGAGLGCDGIPSL
ncbi:hypothetical protein SRABI03_03303 [Microbacterium foliorum]|nr:hypothetical protein SRABI03_03303 [Microbacterium foliorum]